MTHRRDLIAPNRAEFPPKHAFPPLTKLLMVWYTPIRLLDLRG